MEATEGQDEPSTAQQKTPEKDTATVQLFGVRLRFCYGVTIVAVVGPLQTGTGAGGAVGCWILGKSRTC